MDIDLLAKMVRETILDHDAVTLPGIGSFMAEIVPSSFSDKGYTINPPYRRLFFSRREEGDSLLAELYAASNQVPVPSAERIVSEFLAEMKEVLKEKKTVVFPGLGRLRATKENNFFFVADEDLDIYPAGFGLKPVSLKTHEETEDEVAEAVAGLASILSEPAAPARPEEPEAPAALATPAAAAAAASAGNPAPEVPAPAAPAVPEETASEAPAAPAATAPAAPAAGGEPVDPWLGVRKVEKLPPPAWKVVLMVLGGLLALAVVLLAVYAVVARLAPDFVDRFLYSAEDLEFIRRAF